MTDTAYTIEGCMGSSTACYVYVTKFNGDEVASIRADKLTDELIAALEKKAGEPLTGEFQGGTLDGGLAF